MQLVVVTFTQGYVVLQYSFFVLGLHLNLILKPIFSSTNLSIHMDTLSDIAMI